MRKLLLLPLMLAISLGAFGQASPYNLNVFKAQSFTATGQTGATIQLNGLVIPSTVGSSYASGTITLTGVALTTVSFQVLGSSDNGATFYPLPIYTAASPTTTPATTITATAAGLYQINLAGISHIKFVTTGTFTATSVSLTLTGSPNALVSRNGNGGGGSGTVNSGSAGQIAYYVDDGTAVNGTNALPTGTTATTQTTGDNSTKVATDAFVIANQSGFTAGGDLSGTSTSQTVAGIQGHPLPTLATGYPHWNGSAWVYDTPSGSTVNVNGSAVSTPNFNGSTPAPDSGYTPVTWKVSGSNVLGQVPTGGANSVQYNAANTNYIWYSDSLFIVSTASTATATAVSCDGTTCTVTAPNSYTAGQPIQFLATWSPTCLNYAIASVESTGLSSTQFEVSETNPLGIGTVGSTACTGVQSGTGGTVQDASYFSPFAASKLPFFSGHGTTYDYGLSGGTSTDMVNNYTAMVHPHTTAVTGNPSFVILKVSVNDWAGGIGGPCFSAATTEANLQTLMEDAHTDGASVIMMTSQAWPTPGLGCDTAQTLSSQVNDWVRGQGKSSSASTQPAGAYWDRLIDVAPVFTNYSDANFRITSGSTQYHFNDGGNAYLAAMTNAGMGVQGSSIQSQYICNTFSNCAELNAANVFTQNQEIITGNQPTLEIHNTFGGGDLQIAVSNGTPVHTFFQFNGANTLAWWFITGSANAITLQANQCYAFDDATSGGYLLNDPPDTAICREAGNKFDFGNGTYQDKSATINAGVFSSYTAQTTVTGTTAGTAVWSQPQQGTAFKQAVLYLNGYENTTATAQTITLPASFATVGYIITDGGSCAGITISAATITLPASMGATQTGLCEVKGY